MTMKKFQNKYRIASARAPFWDYAWNAAYFVTLCTKNRLCWFGNVADGNMVLSPIGHIANSCWYEIPNHFPFVELGAHIIMPNHVHGIVIIDKPHDGNDAPNAPNVPQSPNVETQDIASLQQAPPSNPSDASERPEPPKPSELDQPKNQFGPQSKNLASIVRGFKIGVTKNARQINPGFQWQPLYHDHIIRNDAAFQHISNYILNNPAKWQEDKFYRTDL